MSDKVELVKYRIRWKDGTKEVVQARNVTSVVAGATALRAKADIERIEDAHTDAVVWPKSKGEKEEGDGE